MKKMRILNKKSDIEKCENETSIHLTFRPSQKDIYNILLLNPNLKTIEIRKIFEKTLPDSLKLHLRKRKISLTTGSIQGCRTDLFHGQVETVEDEKTEKPIEDEEIENFMYFNQLISQKELITILKGNPELKTIQFAEHCEKSISQIMLNLCEFQNIEVRFQNISNPF